jgi:S1-C subfamily serine protease
MYRTRYTNKKRTLSLSIALMILGVVGALVWMLGGNVLLARADGTPGGNVSDPVVRSVDVAKPAVVRILTQVAGRLTVNFSNNSTVTFPQNFNQAYQELLSGSGTFISSHGDILTADHVVNPPPEVLQQAAANDVATYINQHPELGLGQMTADQVAQALQSGQLKSSANFDSRQSQVFMSTDYTGPLTATSLTQVPLQANVDRIEKESAVNQRDVAIVHATFPVDTPSVLLGDSSGVQPQDQLTIIGFPGNGDVSTQPTDLLTSSVNTISVSSIKTTDNGAPVIQVGGNVEQGDSGGPALDAQGNVVGVVSFGISNGNAPGSTSFLQASNSARDLVNSLKLDTTPGKFQSQWSAAFKDYASSTPGHWHKAAQEFQQLATGYPQFKAVSKFLDYAQSQAQSEKVAATPTATSGSSRSTLPGIQIPALAIGVAALILVILAAIGTSAIVIRRRKKGADQARNAPPVAPPVNASVHPNVSPAGGSATSGYVPPPAASRSIPVAPPQEALAAFGGPSQQSAQSTTNTASLRPWPCGHMNRPNARFCSICGEPAPEPPTSVIRQRPEQ